MSEVHSTEYNFRLKDGILGAQMLFVAFGALVLVPILTGVVVVIPLLFMGSLILESFFGIPGLGRHFTTSIGNRDYPVVMGTTLLYAVLIVIANLVVDITYAWLDPRIRYE